MGAGLGVGLLVCPSPAHTVTPSLIGQRGDRHPPPHHQEPLGTPGSLSLPLKMDSGPGCVSKSSLTGDKNSSPWMWAALLILRGNKKSSDSTRNHRSLARGPSPRAFIGRMEPDPYLTAVMGGISTVAGRALHVQLRGRWTAWGSWGLGFRSRCPQFPVPKVGTQAHFSGDEEAPCGAWQMLSKGRQPGPALRGAVGVSISQRDPETPEDGQINRALAARCPGTRCLLRPFPSLAQRDCLPLERAHPPSRSCLPPWSSPGRR